MCNMCMNPGQTEGLPGHFYRLTAVEQDILFKEKYELSYDNDQLFSFILMDMSYIIIAMLPLCIINTSTDEITYLPL